MEIHNDQFSELPLQAVTDARNRLSTQVPRLDPDFVAQHRGTIQSSMHEGLERKAYSSAKVWRKDELKLLADKRQEKKGQGGSAQMIL